LEFSENYHFIFAIKPEYPGAYKLSDASAYSFQKVIILRIDRSELIMWSKQKGHWLGDG
jgi:hypothetical protein